MRRCSIPRWLVFSVMIGVVGCNTELPPGMKLLDKAIDAHGGLEAINKPRKVHLTGHCIHGDGKMTFEEFIDYPQRYRSINKGNLLAGGRGTETTVFRDGVLYRRDRKLHFEKLADPDRQFQHHLGHTIGLVRLKESCKTIKTTGTDSFKGIPLFTVNLVGSNGRSFDVRFHRTSGLLIKTSMAKNSADDESSQFHNLFEDYRDFDGLKVAHKITGSFGDDPNPLATFRITSITLLDEFEEGTFDVP